MRVLKMPEFGPISFNKLDVVSEGYVPYAAKGTDINWTSRGSCRAVISACLGARTHRESRNRP